MQVRAFERHIPLRRFCDLYQNGYLVKFGSRLSVELYSRDVKQSK